MGFGSRKSGLLDVAAEQDALTGQPFDTLDSQRDKAMMAQGPQVAAQPNLAQQSPGVGALQAQERRPITSKDFRRLASERKKLRKSFPGGKLPKGARWEGQNVRLEDGRLIRPKA